MTSIPPAGTLVRVACGEHTYLGTLMPNTTPQLLILKLDNGYNIGILPGNITDITVEGAPNPRHAGPSTAQTPAHHRDAQEDHALPIISILHTGGTIASKVDYETGGVIARYTPEEIVSLFPELAGFARIRSRLVRNMWSEDMRFAHYNIIAREIASEIAAGAQGVIVTHGTDTLHYTAVALSFMLENLPIPVILVGSQRSSDRASSDAAINLISAVFFAAGHAEFKDVGICMHESSDDSWCAILPGTKSRKMHSSRRDAFRAINTTAWARINLGERMVEMRRMGFRTRPEGAFAIHPFKESLRVGLVKTHPNMYAAELLFYKGYDGLLLEGAGIAGHPPINEIDEETKENTRIADALRALVAGGTVVAAATQTIYGAINMNVYSTGRKMQEIGIIGNYTDMTPETGYIKLAWLLSTYPKEQAAALYAKNLCGELSEGIDPGAFP